MLTNAQQRTLRFIRHYIASHQQAPLLTEIATGIGIQSKGVAHNHVRALIEQGYLEQIPGRHRGLRLTEPEEKLKHTLPLLGKVAAGLPIEAIEDQETVDISALLLGPQRFALQIQGDSMVDEGIMDGDTIIVKSQNTAYEGQIVVALIDGHEATVKKISYPSNSKIELIPANSSYQIMHYRSDQVTIQGIVVGQIRCYQ